MADGDERATTPQLCVTDDEYGDDDDESWDRGTPHVPTPTPPPIRAAKQRQRQRQRRHREHSSPYQLDHRNLQQLRDRIRDLQNESNLDKASLEAEQRLSAHYEQQLASEKEKHEKEIEAEVRARMKLERKLRKVKKELAQMKRKPHLLSDLNTSNAVFEYIKRDEEMSDIDDVIIKGDVMALLKGLGLDLDDSIKKNVSSLVSEVKQSCRARMYKKETFQNVKGLNCNLVGNWFVQKYFDIIKVALPGRYCEDFETDEQRTARYKRSTSKKGQRARLIKKTNKYSENQYLSAMDDIFGAHLRYD